MPALGSYRSMGVCSGWGSAERTEPEHCFSRESDDLPLDLDFTASGWSLVTVQGVRPRGWIGATVVDPDRVVRWVAEAFAEGEATYVSNVVQRWWNIEEAGAKLALIFRLQERVTDVDRVELIAQRVARFTREEAAYWL